MKKFITIVGALIVILVLVLCFIDKQHFCTIIETKIVSTAGTKGLRLSFEETSMKFLSFRAKTLSLAHKNIPFAFKLEDLRVSPSLLRLLIFSPKLRTSAKAYEGNLDGSFSFGRDSNSLDGIFEINKVNLSKHPQLEGFGVKSGVFDVDIDTMSVENSKLKKLIANISIEDVDKPLKTVIPGKLISSPFNITLPAFVNLNLKASINIDPRSIEIRSLESKSSLGTIVGKIRALNGKAGTLEGDLLVKLSNSGIKFFGPYLSLIGQGVLNETTKNFKIQILGTSAQPKFTYTLTK